MAQPVGPPTPLEPVTNSLPIAMTADAVINPFASAGGTTPTVDITVDISSSSPLQFVVSVYDYNGGTLIDSQTSPPDVFSHPFSFPPIAVPDAGSTTGGLVSLPSVWVECGAMLDGTYRREGGCTVVIDGD